jgi:hypothetical protein
MCSGRVAKVLLALWLSLNLAGCTSWRLESMGASEIIILKHPDRIRVQGSHLSRQVLYWPEVHGDSLIGRHRQNTTQPDRAVALADVASVATSHRDAGKTTGLVLGIVAALGTAALIAAASMDGPLDNWGQ